jgi:DsbC/DsbD-like thiol-disulfide interchange protein
MIAGKTKIRMAAIAALTVACALLQAQKPLPGAAPRSAAKPAAVLYLYPEQVTVPAGQPTTVALYFRIAPGLHINSHMPKEEGLIPTSFSIPADSGVRLDGAVYPPGTDFALPIDPKTRLSVYTGEFILQARIVAVPGNHLVEAKLRYQACDNNECMPPKTIIAAIDVIGK